MSEILEELPDMTLAQLCRCCQVDAELVLDYVEAGILQPVRREGACTQWRFQRTQLMRLRRAQRLQRDLGVNLEGAALALDLLDEISHLRRRLAARRP